MTSSPRSTRGSALRTVAPAALLLCAGAAMAAAPGTLKPFKATYHASYMGLNGTGTMILAPAGDGRWTYSLDIDSAIADMRQQTTFDVEGGRWRPLSGSDSTKLLIKKSSKQATYDWTSRQAVWSGDVKHDRAGPVALQPGDLDAMLVNLAIPRDVSAGKPLAYRMVDDGRAKSLRYEVAGKASVEYGGSTHPATKVTRTDGDKQTVVWVVDGLPVPARILQRKDGQDEIDLTLESIR